MIIHIVPLIFFMQILQHYKSTKIARIYHFRAVAGVLWYMQVMKMYVYYMEEAGHSERGYSRDAYNRGGMSYDGSYNSYDGSYDSSYARGRGSNAKRDSMGRYSSERGYSRGYSGHNEELMQRINDLMNRTTEPQFKSELQRIQRDIEQM